jgi:hypothetical protein
MLSAAYPSVVDFEVRIIFVAVSLANFKSTTTPDSYGCQCAFEPEIRFELDPEIRRISGSAH